MVAVQRTALTDARLDLAAIHQRRIRAAAAARGGRPLRTRAAAGGAGSGRCGGGRGRAPCHDDRYARARRARRRAERRRGVLRARACSAARFVVATGWRPGPPSTIPVCGSATGSADEVAIGSPTCSWAAGEGGQRGASWLPCWHQGVSHVIKTAALARRPPARRSRRRWPACRCWSAWRSSQSTRPTCRLCAGCSCSTRRTRRCRCTTRRTASRLSQRRARCIWSAA